MAGRFSVEGVFRVVDRMTRPIRRIASRFDRFTNRVKRGFRDLRATARRFRTAFVAIGVAAAAAGAAAIAVLRDVAETGATFDQSITSAAAKFPGQIRRGSEAFAQLEEAAQRVGATTEFSASQAAEALDFLAMAGFGAEQAVAALPGVVDLATAAQMELAEATDVASDTLGAFGMMTDDAAQLGTNLGRVNDVLARTSTSANTTVQQMFEAIRTGGPVAHAAGASIETFSALLGTLAGAGIKGSEAGTGLRRMFMRLQAPAAAGRRALRQLGVETSDADGNMRDIVDIMGDLGGELDGMGTSQRSRILTDIFGATAVTSANVLLDAGSDRLNEYRTSLEGATGAAGEMASTMRDTAQGDMATFTSTVESLKLQVWDVVRGPMRAIVQSMTEWVRANQGWISSGIQDVVQALGTAFEWISGNMPAIVRWGRRIAIVLGVLAIIGAVVSAAMLVLVLAIPAMIAAIVVGLVALVEWLVGAANTVGAAVMGALRSMWAAAVALVEWVVGAATTVGTAVMGALRSMWASVVATLTAAQEFLVGLFVLIGRAVRPYLQPVIDFFAHVAQTIASLWRPVGAFFSRLWRGIAQRARDGFNRLLSVASSIASALRAAWATVGAFFSRLWSGIAKHARAGFNRLLSMASSIASALRAAWAPIGAFFAGLWSGIAEGFRSTVGGVVDAIGQFVGNVRSEGRDALDGEEGAAAPRPQVVSPHGRTAREIHETNTTANAEVTIRDETSGGRAEVTRRPRGGGLRVVRSGAD